MRSRLRQNAAMACMAVSTLVSGALPAQSELSLAQKLVFDRPHLDNLKEPVVLRYTFRQSGPIWQKLNDVFKDRILMSIDKVRKNGAKDLSFEFLSGKRRRPYADITDVKGNPIVILFLNHDIWAQSRVLGGTPNYFRNRIRAALNGRNRVTDVTIHGPNGPIKAKRLVLKPYENDKNIEKFRDHIRKIYEITISPDVPGEVYGIRSYIPADKKAGDGAPVLAEQHLKFDRAGTKGELE